MEQSESIKELAEALASAQAELSNPGKTGKGNYGYYAELGPTLDLVRPIIGKHGLSVVQLPVILEDGSTGLTTQLMHKSGEWVKSTFALMTQQSTPQAQGSALTYARRYGLSAMLGVAGDDDDGEAGTKGAAATKTRVVAQKAGAGQTTVSVAPVRTVAGTDPATPLQRKRITAFLRGKGAQDVDMVEILQKEYGIEDPAKMTAGEARQALETMEKAS
jgi:ERF superfamily